MTSLLGDGKNTNYSGPRVSGDIHNLER